MLIEQGNNLTRVKRSNQAAIRRLVYHYSPVTRGQLASELGLTMPTITKNVNMMLQAGVVRELDALGGESKTLGRKVRPIELVAASRYFVGVEMRSTRRGVCVTDYRGEIAVHRVDNNLLVDYQENVDCCCGMIREAVEASGVSWEKIYGIGICVPGLVDSGDKLIRKNSHYDWEMRYLAKDFAAGLGYAGEISLENNASARAYGAQLFRRELLNGVTSFAYMFVSSGIACPIIYNALPDYGVAVGAGEAGHMVMDPEGPLCRCGNRGCLEALASEHAVIRSCHRAVNMGQAKTLSDICGGKEPSLKEILEAQEMGDRDVEAIVDTAIFNLALATANIDNLTRPDVILFEAEILNSQRNRDKFMEITDKNVYAGTADRTRFEFLPTDPLSGARGAAAVAIRVNLESEII